MEIVIGLLVHVVLTTTSASRMTPLGCLLGSKMKNTDMNDMSGCICDDSHYVI
ncbi:hypothetical protein PR001_g13112 [Phytophthora rubi]|uniref:RxLR effector protein n=1 Tax=Phytophthora rubi TaxID=129364 RepID=A0A6A3LTP8_9STRA|nr:hypothetical protein PR001_g13112 [Phytophthora rubi]